MNESVPPQIDPDVKRLPSADSKEDQVGREELLAGNRPAFLNLRAGEVRKGQPDRSGENIRDISAAIKPLLRGRSAESVWRPQKMSGGLHHPLTGGDFGVDHRIGAIGFLNPRTASQH
jgi:hypothetical protein